MGVSSGSETELQWVPLTADELNQIEARQSQITDQNALKATSGF